MRGSVIGLFLLITLNLTAQRWPTELWHEGKIVLDTGDTLKGLVKYDLQQDLLQFNDQKKVVEAYTARKVLLFEIFDNTVSQYRTFYALPFSATSGYKTPTFFELLTEGKMTLLSRESLQYKTYSSPYFYYGSYSRLEMVYVFYFLEENGEIVPFQGKKADLLGMMGRYRQDVDKFIRKNRLQIDEKQDFTRIVSYYNSFF